MSDKPEITHSSISKKAERIASAIFLVSNGMSDTEVLKIKVRNLSLDLVSLCLSFKDYSIRDGGEGLRSVEKTISELISFLNITSISGLVSEMNASILKAELEAFSKDITFASISPELNHTHISKDFFQKDIVAVESSREISSLLISRAPLYIKDNGASSQPSALIETSEIGRPILNQKDKLNRKDQRNRAIVALIAKKGEVSIKDISSSIKGCSEKTVQRELNSLIQQGVIKKTGERRWSKYSLL